MDKFFAYWWHGVRLLICFFIAWFVSLLPITLGGLAFRPQIDSGSPLGVALVVVGVLYAIVILPAVFSVLCKPLPPSATTINRPKPGAK